jgi:hypothetical protein
VNITADVTVPVITLAGANPQSLELGSAYVELGARASDNVDGPISTRSIVIDAAAVNSNVEGTYTVTYDVKDAAGNKAQVTRTVNITADVTVPVITLAGANPQSLELGLGYVELSARASDNIDGTISTRSIVIDATSVNVNVVGSYAVTYNVTDAAGNNAAQVIRTVNITADVTVPVIRLTGANPQSLELGTAYAELGASASDSNDGNISSLITIDATDVNINIAGNYSVTYNVRDAAGNNAIQATRSVKVTAPATNDNVIVGGNSSAGTMGVWLLLLMLFMTFHRKNPNNVRD